MPEDEFHQVANARYKLQDVQGNLGNVLLPNLKGPETPRRPGLISCRKVTQESFPTFFHNHWMTSYANGKNND